MTTNIQVICRFRPQLQGQELSTLQFSDDGKSILVDSGQIFNFDKVFHPGTQDEVFESAAKPIIEAVLQGFNGTVVAYGQTGSGKTHTMEGGQGEDAGIIKRMVNTVFDFIEKSPDNLEYRIKISVVELYMEKIRDLQFIKKNDLKIREDKNQGVYIQDVTETSIAEQQEIYEILKICNSNRQISATNMNEQSSRSHMIFLMTVTSVDLNDQSAKTGKLFLVDLAGSEKVSKTGAEGRVLEEAKGINKSLSALGQVINALTDGSQHVPYRDSKLTRILQCSFGGNSRTTLIVTCSPAQYNIQETLSTLRFGIRAKSIKNKPKINKEHTIEELKIIVADKDKEILLLQEQLSNYKNGMFISDEDKQIIKEIQEDNNKDQIQGHIDEEAFNQQQEMYTKLEQDLEFLKQKNFILKSNEDEIRNALRNKEEEIFEKQQEYQEQIHQLHSDHHKKTLQIATIFSHKLGAINENELTDQDFINKQIDQFLKDKISSKLKQINYLYKKYHKDCQNEQLLAFLADTKADFNIQNDQLNELNNQVNSLKLQNSELLNINDYQKNLLDTLEKTQDLLEIEKQKSQKLEKQLSKSKEFVNLDTKTFDDKCAELNLNVDKMLQHVYQVIASKNRYQKDFEKSKKICQQKQDKIDRLEQENHRLSIENQKLFVKYDSLKEMMQFEKEQLTENSINNSSICKKTNKIQKPLKGGTKFHSSTQSMLLLKENNAVDDY